MGRRGGFDNTEIVLAFSKHERNPKRDESTGATVPGGAYYRCIPDLPVGIDLCLTDAHMIFDPENGTLTISKNRNAR